MVLKPLILGITSLITRYSVTILLAVKIAGQKVRLGGTGGYFGLFWNWSFAKNLLFVTFNLVWCN